MKEGTCRHNWKQMDNIGLMKALWFDLFLLQRAGQKTTKMQKTWQHLCSCINNPASLQDLRAWAKTHAVLVWTETELILFGGFAFQLSFF